MKRYEYCQMDEEMVENPTGNYYSTEEVDERLAEKNARIAELEEELEHERMRLVACGIVAMQNTNESRKERLSKSNRIWSASYEDVCSAVDREIDLRTEVAALEAQLEDVKLQASRSMRDVSEARARAFSTEAEANAQGRLAAEYMVKLVDARAQPDEALRLLREARNAIYELSDYGERMELKRRLNDALAAHKDAAHG